MTKNPFRFGVPGGTPPLIGRQREVDDLVRAFHEGRHLCLVGPRGGGKTAVLSAASRRASAEGLQTIYVDLLPAISTRRFAELYASALTLDTGRTVESMQEAVQQLVPTIMPRVTITGTGRPGLQLDLWDRERDLRALLGRILDAPEQMAKASEQPVVVVFDGFEDLLDVGEADLLQQLSQAVRRHRRVGYSFVVRKESTAENTFTKPKSPFYRLAEPIALSPVDPAVMAEGLKRLFGAADIEIEDALLESLLEQAGQVPHSIQFLSHALFDISRDDGRAEEEHLRAALTHVLDASAYAYKAQWDELSTHQRNLVLAIARGYTERLHSQRMVFQLGLGSPSTVSKNLRVLSEREILDRRGENIRFVDPFFGLWLQRRMT